MLQQVKAIILHSVKYRESGIITQTYTDKYGRQSFLIHGVRKKKSKAKAYIFQPLNIIDIVAYVKENRELQKVKEVQQSIQTKNLHFDIHRSTIAIFLGEVLSRSVRESEPNEQLFQYLEKAIQMLDICHEGLQNFHLIFLIQLSKFIGIYPVRHTDMDKYQINEEYSLSSFLGYSLSEIAELKVNSTLRNKMLDQLLRYYEDHIDGFGQIRSLDILREIFH